MKFIDLRKEYPHLDTTYSEYPISQKIQAVFEEYRLAEQAFEKRKTRHGEISLDSDLIFEANILETFQQTEEYAIKQIQNEQLYHALCTLPKKQARRIYAYYFLDMKLDEIALKEKTSLQAVHYSIQIAKKNLKKILKDLFEET